MNEVCQLYGRMQTIGGHALRLILLVYSYCVRCGTSRNTQLLHSCSIKKRILAPSEQTIKSRIQSHAYAYAKRH